MKNNYGFVLIPIIAAIVIFGALLSLFYMFVGSPYRMYGKSMQPAIKDKEYLYASKLKSDREQMKKNDIIIFDAPKSNELVYIKRIAAVPGDSVIVKENKIYINDKEYKDFAASPTNNWEGGFTKEGIAVTVPADSYFVLGDDRLHSSDSRIFGFVKKEDIRAVYKFCYMNCQ